MVILDRNYLIKKFSLNYLEQHHELDLSWSQIDEIEPLTFEGLRKLKTLILCGNQLRKIHADTFKGLDELVRLDLDMNKLEDIDANIFDGLPVLKCLELRGNNLKRVKSNVFDRVTNLESLCLSVNQIEKIDNTVFAGLSNLKVLQLNENNLRRIHSECFKPLKNSICLIEIYKNKFDFKIRSYLKEGRLPYNLIKEEIQKRLDENEGFESNWDRFLNQFPVEIAGIESESAYIQAKEDLIRYEETLDREMQKRVKRSNNKNEIKALREEIEKLEEAVKREKLKLPKDSKTFVGSLLNDRYKVLSVLGEGGYGKVYKVVDTTENSEKAVKLVRQLGEAAKKGALEWNNFTRIELDVLKRIRCDHIVQYFDSFTFKVFDFRYLAVVTEFCEKGDLDLKMNEYRASRKTIDHLVILLWITDATKGL